METKKNSSKSMTNKKDETLTQYDAYLLLGIILGIVAYKLIKFIGICIIAAI